MSNKPVILNPIKNKVPSAGKNVVERAALLQLITQKNNQVNLITAPAGFGKSTIIIQWLKQQPKPYAWFSVDENDNEPKRFFSYLIQAFTTINPELTEEISGLIRNDMIPEWVDIVNLLIHQLEENGDEMILVIDDFHLIHEPGIIKAINYLIEHAPAFIKFFILSRQEALIQSSKLRMKGLLFELHEQDLRFSEQETEQFLSQTMMLALDKPFIKQLNQKTEGWIAGMQMAAISLQNTNDISSFISNFKGTNKLVVDYLLEEVMAGQVESVQQFLLLTSAADKFNAELAEALTGFNNCAAIINSIDHAQLFLVSMDEDRNWYRYHHLFRDLLRNRLNQLMPGKTAYLHQLLSNWFEQKEEISEAISYALRLPDQTHALQLLDKHAQGYFMTHSDLSVFESFECQIADAKKEPYPGILIAKAWRKFSKYDLEGVDYMIEQAIATLPHAGYTKQRQQDLSYNIEALKAIALRLKGKLKESEKASKTALEKLPATALAMKGVHAFNLSQTYTRLGEYDLADQYSASGFQANLNAYNYYVISMMQASRTFTMYERGRLPESKNIAESALQFIKEKQIESLPSNSKLYLTLSLLYYQENQLAEAMQWAEKSLSAALRGNDVLMICNAQITKALSLAALDETEEAARLLADTESQLNILPAHNLVEITTPLLLLVYLCMGNDTRMAEASKQITFQPNDEFSMAKGYEAIFIAEWYLRHQQLEQAEQLLNWINQQKVSSSLTLFHLHFGLNKAILAYKKGQTELAGKILQPLLELGAKTGAIRLFKDKKEWMSLLMPNLKLMMTLTNEISEFVDLIRNQSVDKEKNTYIPKFKQKLVEPLTEREQEVLHYIEKGLSNKQIADKMFVSVNTIKTHIKNLYGKMGCENRAEALQIAASKGLL